jgi:hypothetical protein
MKTLHIIFEKEVRRMATEESRPISEIVDELAGLCGVSDRTIRLYRSGQQSIPADALPIFCRRFGSRALLHALEAECAEPLSPPADGLCRWFCGRAAEATEFFAEIFGALGDGLSPQAVGEIERRAQTVAAAALASGRAVRAQYEAHRG